MKKMFQAKEMGEHFLMEEERRDDDLSDGEVFQKKAQVFVISRAKAIALVVIVVVIIIFFAVISGVFSARKARKDALKEIQRDKRQGDLSGSTSRSVINATDATISVISSPKPTSTAGSSSAITPTDHDPKDLKPWSQIRLPQNIRPIHYDLYLDPDLEMSTFQGNVSILIEVTAKSEFMSYILIHIKDMNVTRAKVHKVYGDMKSDTNPPGVEVALKRTFEYPENDFFIFELKNDLEIGKYVMYMEYKSRFSRQLNGLYISTYTNEKGQKRRLATTKFEPTDARDRKSVV